MPVKESSTSVRHERIGFVVLALLLFVFDAKLSCSAQVENKNTGQIRILEPVDLQAPWLTSTGIIAKPWTNQQKSEIREAVVKINADHLGIVQSATAPFDVIILRVTKIPEQYSAYSGRDEALTLGNLIFITDNFFQIKDNGVKRILHELFHIIDTGSIHSYSYGWLKIVGRNLPVMKLKTQVLRFDAYREYLTALKNSGKCPSAYSLTSLQEAFAEFGSNMSTDPSFSKDYAETMPIFDAAIHPSKEEIKWKQLFNDGIVAYLSNDNASATRFFMDANQISPASPMPNLYMSRCFTKSDPEFAMKQSIIALKKFDTLGINDSDEEKQNLLLDTAGLLFNQKRFSHSEVLLSRIVKANSGNMEALELRAKSRLKQGNSFSGLMDLLASKTALPNANCIQLDWSSDLVFAENVSKQLATRADSVELAGDILNYLAEYCESDKKSKMREQALSYYKHELKVNGNRVNLASKCALVNLELGKLDEATRYTRLALATQPLNLLARLIGTRLSELVSPECDYSGNYYLLRLEIESLPNSRFSLIKTPYAQLTLKELAACEE